MDLRKGFARLVAVVALFALMTSVGLISGSTTDAQSPPYRAYGAGLSEGDVVAAVANDQECSSTTATAAGEWAMNIVGADCGASPGDEIGFTLNGEAVDETVVYSDGGTPSGDGYPVATGITMTLAMDAPADAGDAPAPSDTGSAGLVTEGGASLWFAMALGALALATLAGGRVATRHDR